MARKRGMWASPFAAPPLRQSPNLGRFGMGVCASVGWYTVKEQSIIKKNIVFMIVK